MEKQIEEIARAIGELYKEPPKDIPPHDLNIATYLYDKGYRKQSEVAREIFAEIESMLNLHTIEDRYGEYISTDLVDEFAELKKKYLEVQK